MTSSSTFLKKLLNLFEHLIRIKVPHISISGSINDEPLFGCCKQAFIINITNLLFINNSDNDLFKIRLFVFQVSLVDTQHTLRSFSKALVDSFDNLTNMGKAMLRAIMKSLKGGL